MRISDWSSDVCSSDLLNRVGTDGNGLQYSGDSAVIDFLGHPLSECSDEEVVVTTTLQAAQLQAHRERFPALLDGDRFTLSLGGSGRNGLAGTFTLRGVNWDQDARPRAEVGRAASRV